MRPTLSLHEGAELASARAHSTGESLLLFPKYSHVQVLLLKHLLLTTSYQELVTDRSDSSM